MRVGVIGVGTIAEALVDAMLTGPRADGLSIVLSPRSAERSTRLAQRYASVTVAAGNQQVIDDCDTVIIGVLPEQVADVCAALAFRADQTVVGLAAGWAPSKLAPLIAPASHVCQLIPLPMVAWHRGPLVLYPRLAPVVDLLAGCGEIVSPATEFDIPLFSAASASMSTFFAFHAGVTGWLTTQGVGAPMAKDYVSALFSGLAAEAVETSYDELPSLVPGHETPGGLNQQLRSSLQADGVFDSVSSYLDALLRRLRG